MSELRQDILSGEWVIFAANRSERPYDFVKKSEPKKDTRSKCPFCPQNSSLTPETIVDDKKYGIRVFDNKYPALDIENAEINSDSVQRGIEGRGFHEIIVDTAGHTAQLADFSLGHVIRVLEILQERFRELKERDGVKYVQVFKNNGPEAGMSLMHSHWQIIAAPVINRLQRDINYNSRLYKEKNGKCPLCAVIENELENKERLIESADGFAAFSPYAARLSYEVWIAPLRHFSSFSELAKSELDSLAVMLKRMLLRIRGINPEVSYNLCFMDEPAGCEGGVFHWHIRILPRLGSFAGYEFATGSYINPVLPETAAKLLREADCFGKG